MSEQNSVQFLVSGENETKYFVNINHVFQYRYQKLRTYGSHMDIYFVVNNVKELLLPNQYVVVGRTYETTKIFNSRLDANLYTHQLMQDNDMDGYINVGIIREMNDKLAIDWYWYGRELNDLNRL